MKHLSHIWLIALKDLKIFVTDRLALGFALLFPFLFIILFSLMPTGSDETGEIDQRRSGITDNPPVKRS